MSIENGQLRLPDGITEIDLIDLADGRLSADREGVVLRALKADPALSTMVRQMRADAAGLAALGAVHAPAGLAEGIEAKLQSQALKDLARESQGAAGQVPVSSVRVSHPSPLRLVFENVWTRRLAAAAAVVIVSGAGMVGIREMARAYNRSSGTTIVDKGTPDAGGTSAAPVPAPDAPAPTTLASKPDAPTTDAAAPAPGPAVAMDAPKVEDMTEARAARLALEGRLVVSVRAKIAEHVTKRLEALARGGRDDAWHVVPLAEPREYAMLTTPSWTIAPAHVPATHPNTPTGIAGSEPGSPKVSAPSTSSAGPLLPQSRAVVKAIFEVQVAPGEQGVAGLLQLVREGLPEGATIVLRELAQGVTPEVSLDPDNVLWWNAGPGRWVSRARVPVVVEGLE